MTAVLATACAGFAIRDLLDTRIRVTVVNHTDRTLDRVVVTAPGGKPWRFRLTAGESASGVVRPTEDGLLEVSTDRGGVGFRARGWVEVEALDLPTSSKGRAFGLRGYHGHSPEWWQIWYGLRTLTNPFRGGMDGRFEGGD